jgi:anti-sigma28 factor (negative regulator of flagellin synthesis)
MVNFVNNNISGNGKIFVTVVNVFGSWVGDFITPGSSKQVKSNSAVNNAVNAGDNQNNSSSNNSPQSSNNQSNRSDGAETIDKAKIEAFSEGIVKEATSNSHEFINGLIAGAKSEVNNSIVQGASSKTVVSQKLKVNLAFLILLLPLAILWFIRKRISRIYTKLLSILL